MSAMNVSSSLPQVTKQEHWQQFSLTKTPIVTPSPFQPIRSYNVEVEDTTKTLSYYVKYINREKRQQIEEVFAQAVVSICKGASPIPESNYKKYFLKFLDLPPFDQITTLFETDVCHLRLESSQLKDVKGTPITHSVVNNKKLERNQILYIMRDLIGMRIKPNQKDADGLTMDQLGRAKKLKIDRCLKRLRTISSNTFTTIPLRSPELTSHINKQFKTELKQSKMVLLIGPGLLDFSLSSEIELDFINKKQVFGISPQLIEILIGCNQNAKIAVLDNSPHLFKKMRIDSKCFDRYLKLIKYSKQIFKLDFSLKLIEKKIGDLKNESREKKLQHRLQYLLRDATSLEFYLKNKNKFSYIIATNVFLHTNRIDQNLFAAMVQSLKKNGQLIIDAISLRHFLPEYSKSALQALLTKTPITSLEVLPFESQVGPSSINRNMDPTEKGLRLRSSRRFSISSPNSYQNPLYLSATVSPLFVFRKA